MLDQLAAQQAQAEATTTNAQASATSTEFANFLAANGGASLNAQQRDALFRQFVEWQQRQRQAQPAR
jgi:hypothetical protein